LITDITSSPDETCHLILEHFYKPWNPDSRHFGPSRLDPARGKRS
jgi:hypothetical protein